MARKTKTITGRLEQIERLNNSRDGNPRYAVTVGGYEYRTGVDYSVGYEVSNHKVGAMVTLTLTGTHAAVLDIQAAPAQ